MIYNKKYLFILIILLILGLIFYNLLSIKENFFDAPTPYTNETIIFSNIGWNASGKKYIQSEVNKVDNGSFEYNNLKSFDSLINENSGFQFDLVFTEGIEKINASGDSGCFPGLDKYIGKIKKIVFPNSLKSIGDSCFVKFYSLKEIVFPNGLEKIGRNTFKDSSQLISVDINQNVNIENDTFHTNTTINTNTNETTELVVNNEIQYYNNFNAIINNEIQNIIRIEYLFTNEFNIDNNIDISEEVNHAGDLTEDVVSTLSLKNKELLILKEGITSIGKYAFRQFTNLTTIIIPSSVKFIGTGCFHGCSNLNEVYFKQNSQLEYIFPYAFHKCNMNYIHFPSKIKQIGIFAFSLCSKLKNVYFNLDSTPIIHKYSFDRTVDNVYMPLNSQVIDDTEIEYYDRNKYNETFDNGMLSAGDYKTSWWWGTRDVRTTFGDSDAVVKWSENNLKENPQRIFYATNSVKYLMGYNKRMMWKSEWYNNSLTGIKKRLQNANDVIYHDYNYQNGYRFHEFNVIYSEQGVWRDMKDDDMHLNKYKIRIDIFDKDVENTIRNNNPGIAVLVVAAGGPGGADRGKRGTGGGGGGEMAYGTYPFVNGREYELDVGIGRYLYNGKPSKITDLTTNEDIVHCWGGGAGGVHWYGGGWSESDSYWRINALNNGRIKVGSSGGDTGGQARANNLSFYWDTALKRAKNNNPYFAYFSNHGGDWGHYAGAGGGGAGGVGGSVPDRGSDDAGKGGIGKQWPIEGTHYYAPGGGGSHWDGYNRDGSYGRGSSDTDHCWKPDRKYGGCGNIQDWFTEDCKEYDAEHGFGGGGGPQQYFECNQNRGGHGGHGVIKIAVKSEWNDKVKITVSPAENFTFNAEADRSNIVYSKNKILYNDRTIESYAPEIENTRITSNRSVGYFNQRTNTQNRFDIYGYDNNFIQSIFTEYKINYHDNWKIQNQIRGQYDNYNTIREKVIIIRDDIIESYTSVDSNLAVIDTHIANIQKIEGIQEDLNIPRANVASIFQNITDTYNNSTETLYSIHLKINEINDNDIKTLFKPNTNLNQYFQNALGEIKERYNSKYSTATQIKDSKMSIIDKEEFSRTKEYERQQRILSETDMATKRGELLGQNFIDNLSNSEIISLQNKVTDTQNNINMYSTTEGNIAENTDIINNLQFVEIPNNKTILNSKELEKKQVEAQYNFLKENERNLEKQIILLNKDKEKNEEELDILKNEHRMITINNIRKEVNTDLSYINEKIKKQEKHANHILQLLKSKAAEKELINTALTENKNLLDIQEKQLTENTIRQQSLMENFTNIYSSYLNDNYKKYIVNDETCSELLKEKTCEISDYDNNRKHCLEKELCLNKKLSKDSAYNEILKTTNNVQYTDNIELQQDTLIDTIKLSIGLLGIITIMYKINN